MENIDENESGFKDIQDETEREQYNLEKKEKREKYIELMKERDKNIKQEIINLVMRQTTYSEEEAKNELEKNNYKFHDVLKNFMNNNIESNNIEGKTQNKPINVQQTIFKEIRTMMDSASRKQRWESELNRRIQEQKKD